MSKLDDIKFETLFETINALTKRGYKEDFRAKDDCIIASYCKKEYQPSDLTIVKNFRFDGMTNPADEAALFAIEANDGTKGTLVMSYGAKHSQNVDLIKKIKKI